MIPILVSKDFDMFQLYSSENEPINDTRGAPIYVLNNNPTLPDNNAEGRLTDAISCTVTQELNGMYELEMEYPLDGVNYNNIGIRDVILARPNKDAALQPFRIYKITKPLDGIITVYARHLVYDLKGIVVKPFKASGIQEALSAIKANSMTFNPFTFRSSKTSTTEFEVTKPTEIWELLTSNEGSLLDVYGGELTFNNYQIGIEDHIGMDRGVSVKYGLNMTELEQEEDYADCYTSVVGFYKDDETCIYGDIINSSVPFERVKVLPVDFSEYFDRETKPTKAQIDELARTYVDANQIGLPNLNWKINFVALDDTVEYQYLATSQYVGIGDTVTVKYTALGVDAKARAVAIEWNVLEDKHISVSLGSVKNTLTSRLASNSRIASQVPNRGEVMSISSEVSQRLTQTILGAKGGSARFIDENGDGMPDTLYIADNDDPSRARKVWRFNYEGWAASSNGYEGPFDLGATLDDGIVANFITAGVLNANLIKIVSSGDIGAGYGDCSMEFDGEFLKARHVKSGNSMVKLGTQIDTSGNVTYAHGDLKIWRYDDSDESDTNAKRIIWLGAEEGSHGLIINSGGTGTDRSSISLIFNPDAGMMFTIRDYDGNTVFAFDELDGGKLKINKGAISSRKLSVVDSNGDPILTIDDTDNGTLQFDNGTISCKRLIVNGQEITPTQP